MRYNIIIIAIIALLSSCSKNDKIGNIYEINTEASRKTDNTAKLQLTEYFKSFKDIDIRILDKYTYEDTYFWYIDKTNCTREQAKDHVFTKIRELNKKISDSGNSYIFKVGGIDNRLSTNNVILVVIDYTIMININGMSGGDYGEIIGVSFNKGDNWTFLENNSTTKEILGYKFNENIINRLLE